MTNTKKHQQYGALEKINMESKGVTFFASVEFGVLSKNCEGFGICRIDSEKQNGTFSTKKRCASCSYRSKINYLNCTNLTIELQKGDIKKRSSDKYFSTGYFILEEDFETSFFIDQLQVEKLIKIKKGGYPILESDSSYLIRFS